MQKKIGMLAVLLAVQLVLAVAMSFTGPSLEAHRPDTALLDLDGRTPDRLTLDGPDKQEVVLARKGDGWVLPGTGDFPADKTKVNRLLDELKGLKRGLAVATTEAAQKRFKVSDDAFERRVKLALNDETLATLYFGTSPGMRQVSARTAKDKAVYTTEFGIYDAPVKPEDWEDKSVLKVPSDEIGSIILQTLTLTREAKGPASEAAKDGQLKTAAQATWGAEHLQDGETVNQAKADALVQAVSALTVDSVLGREDKPEYGLEAPALAFSVQRKGGGTIEYRLGKREKEKDYVLKVSTRPEYFRLPDYTGEALVKAAGREQLVTTLSAGAGGAGGTAQPADAAGASDQAPAKEGSS